jgi:hypothetical protein
VRPAAGAGPVAIPPSRRKLRRNLIGAALVSVGGLVLAVVAQPLSVRIVGAVLFVGTGALLIAGARIMRIPEPILIVANDGLRHRTLGLIPWDDIKALPISRGPLGASLHIDVVDQDAYLGRVSSRFGRLLLRRDAATGRIPLGISEAALPFSAELLRDLIEERAGRTWPH